MLLDFETCSKNPHKTQPTQLAAVAIDGRRLEVIGDFNSYINCEFDKEKQAELGLDDIEDEALQITKITVEQIKGAPSKKVVWNNFTDWVTLFNTKKTKWTAPILCGYNNNNFDDIIINRLAKEYGPWDDEYGKNSLFHPIHNIDLLKLTFYWFENNQETHSLSMDSMRTYMGMPNESAHNAIYDVKQSADLMIRYLKLARTIAPKTKFKGSFGAVVDKKKKAK